MQLETECAYSVCARCGVREEDPSLKTEDNIIYGQGYRATRGGGIMAETHSAMMD
jgi:hypothetical protein